ncbi:MAG TPA: hypothetical protein VFC56_03920 [Stellaceae bacterium]|nr:hypothetical protein [Stellaceae bacterium]
MPVVTVYLSRLIGIVSLIVAAAMLADKATVVTAVEHLGQDRTALLLLGTFRVVAGAAIVLIHNVWTRGFWPLVVTLTGWALLVRGVINLFLPPEVMSGLFAQTQIVDFYYLYASIPLMLGAYLTLRGFSATAAPFETVLPPPNPGR